MPDILTMNETPSRSLGLRLSYLDGVRGVAALYVVLHHAALQVYPYPGFPGAPWPVRLFQFGHIAVAAFIVLSGFCLTLPVIRAGWTLPEGSAGHWLMRRAIRLLVPYWANIALCLVLLWTILGHQTGTHWDLCTEVVPYDILPHILVVQDLLPEVHPINHVYWSVVVEWQIYFFFPLLVWIARVLKPRVAAIVGVGLGAVLCAVLYKTWWHFWQPQFLALFALGMYGAHIADRVRNGGVGVPKLPWLAIASCLFLISAALCFFWGWAINDTMGPFFDIAFGPAIVCLLIGLANCPTQGAARFFAWRPVAYLGTISYSLYLMHAPLLQVVSQYVVIPLHITGAAAFVVTAVLGLPVSLLGSMLFFWLVEGPAHRWARRLTAQ